MLIGWKRLVVFLAEVLIALIAVVTCALVPVSECMRRLAKQLELSG